MKILETILNVKAASPEIEKAIAKDLSVLDQRDLSNELLERMSLDYPNDDGKRKPKVVEELGNSGQDFPLVEDKGTL